MTLPRYDLFGDPTTWFDSIKMTPRGAWYRAKDVQPLLDQFVAMGGVIPDALCPDGEAYGARPIVLDAPLVTPSQPPNVDEVAHA